MKSTGNNDTFSFVTLSLLFYYVAFEKRETSEQRWSSARLNIYRSEEKRGLEMTDLEVISEEQGWLKPHE